MAAVTEPFPISLIAGRYLLFDIDTISHARRAHNICGVLIGTIPHMSQQNIFLGLPLELMPEEARILVEGGHAYLVDEVETHRTGFGKMSREDRLEYLRIMDLVGTQKAKNQQQKRVEKAAQAFRKKGLSPVPHRRSVVAESRNSEITTSAIEAGSPNAEASIDTAMFETPPMIASMPEQKFERQFITPTTSYPPLTTPYHFSTSAFPAIPSYPLFRYLHLNGYFSMPGVRFGCQYSVYPGDPLRFHSHFLATGLNWDDEFELLDIVGGGRLGTGVKKAYLLGGEDVGRAAEKGKASVGMIRAFSIEWAGL